MRGALSNKRNVAIAFGAALFVVVVLIAVTTDLGSDDVSGDVVASVDGEDITQEEFDVALGQAATRQGLPEPPAPEDPQFEVLRDEALSDLLDTAWIQAEAEEQGVEASDREVEQEFATTKEQNFKTEAEYQQFLKESGFTQEDVDLRVRLQVLSNKIQEKVLGDAQEVPEEDVEEFYEANKEQFAQPETRDIRIVKAADAAAADQALAALEADNSPASWKAVAAQYSTDTATKDKGGVRQAVTEGSQVEGLDAAVFDAEQGEVVGPVEAADGVYVLQVDKVTPGTTQSIDEVRAQIEGQLGGQVQQEAFGAFLSDYRDRWTELTVCADDFLTDRCDNFTGSGAEPCPDPNLPEEQQKQQLAQTGCPPPVLSTSPGAPGSFLPFVPSQGQPQRPHPPGEDAAAPTGVPGGFPGTIPGAPPGAGGAPPPGAAGGAPPPG